MELVLVSVEVGVNVAISIGVVVGGRGSRGGSNDVRRCAIIVVVAAAGDRSSRSRGVRYDGKARCARKSRCAHLKERGWIGGMAACEAVTIVKGTGRHRRRCDDGGQDR